MPGVYNKLGIQFAYPDNWTLDESEAFDGESSVSVYSPGGAFWSVIVHPAEYEPDDLVDTALQTMREQYEQLDAEPYEEEIAGRDVVGCDMNFYCLDLTNTALVRSFSTDEATYLVLCQADDREYEEVGGIFEAMTQCLVAPERFSQIADSAQA